MIEHEYPRRAVVMARVFFSTIGATALLVGIGIIASLGAANLVGILVAVIGAAVLAFGAFAPTRTCGNVGTWLMGLTGV
jgi:hypothetical protein